MKHLPKLDPSRPHVVVGDASVDLIRELAVTPPVKGMASMKAATDVFEASLADAEAGTPRRAEPKGPAD